MFSYDIRFSYARDDIKQSIYERKIDLENVQQFEIVCYTYARVLVDLLSLFNIHAEIVLEDGSLFRHAYVMVYHQGKVLKLDPTKKHDTTRVKLHSPTLDFQTMIDDPIFSDQLAEADQEILAKTNNNVDLTVFYDSEHISKLIDVINESARKRDISAVDLFFDKIYAVQCLINTRSDLTRYDDIDYYLSYLLKKFNVGNYVKPMILFKNIDQEYTDIINIVVIDYPFLAPIFYVVKKVNENYKMRQINLDKVREIMNEYSNCAYDYFFKQLIDNVSKRIR